MDWRQRALIAEVIFLFDGAAIVREMHYETFRDLATRGEPLPELARTRCKTAYAAIGEQLRVEAICCFYAPFDAHGVLSPNWEMPLRELAHSSGEGPDLGHGPIRLARRGQCSLPWHATRLWRPALGSDGDECQAIQRAVAANTLGLRPGHAEHASATQKPNARRPATAPTASNRAEPSAGPASPAPAAPDLGPEASTGPREQPAGTEPAPKAPRANPSRRHEAEVRFDDTFGPDAPRVSLRQQVRQQSARMAEMRTAHAAEIRELRETYEARIDALKTEIARLRASAGAPSRERR